MPKRVSMKGRGLEAVYGAFDPAPVRRPASIDAYVQPVSPEQQEEDPALLKATFYLDHDTIDLLENLWLAERRRGTTASRSRIRPLRSTPVASRCEDPVPRPS